MINQYPHTIKVTVKTGSTQDANGDWTGGSTSNNTYSCRAEVNTKNAIIAAADGTQIRYDWIVYMPLPAITGILGSDIEVKEGERVLCKSTLKQFSVGQLNQRLWL